MHSEVCQTSVSDTLNPPILANVVTFSAFILISPIFVMSALSVIFLTELLKELFSSSYNSLNFLAVCFIRLFSLPVKLTQIIFPKIFNAVELLEVLITHIIVKFIQTLIYAFKLSGLSIDLVASSEPLLEAFSEKYSRKYNFTDLFEFCKTIADNSLSSFKAFASEKNFQYPTRFRKHTSGIYEESEEIVYESKIHGSGHGASKESSSNILAQFLYEFYRAYNICTARANNETGFLDSYEHYLESRFVDFRWPVIPIILTVIPFIPVYIGLNLSSWLNSKLKSDIHYNEIHRKIDLIRVIFRGVFSILERVENLVASCIFLALKPLLNLKCVRDSLVIYDEKVGKYYDHFKDMEFLASKNTLNLYHWSKYLCFIFSSKLKSVVPDRTLQDPSFDRDRGSNSHNTSKESTIESSLSNDLSKDDSPTLDV